MKIIEIKVLKGPNYWSIRRPKLIQMKLDLEEMELRPTNSIGGFRERLEKLFPSMYEHRCSVGEAGGFFQRVEEGTWMGHVIEHIALEFKHLPEWIRVLAARAALEQKANIMWSSVIWKKMRASMPRALR